MHAVDFANEPVEERAGLIERTCCRVEHGDHIVDDIFGLCDDELLTRNGSCRLRGGACKRAELLAEHGGDVIGQYLGIEVGLGIRVIGRCTQASKQLLDLRSLYRQLAYHAGCLGVGIGCVLHRTRHERDAIGRKTHVIALQGRSHVRYGIHGIGGVVDGVACDGKRGFGLLCPSLGLLRLLGK